MCGCDVCGCASPRPEIPVSRNIPFSRYVSPEHHISAVASRERLLLPERIPSRQACVDTPLTNGKDCPVVLRISIGVYLIYSRIDIHLKVSLDPPLLKGLWPISFSLSRIT